MTKLSKSLWGRFLFQDRGILPTKRLLIIYVIFSLGLISGTAWGLSWTIIIAGNILFLLLSLLDLFASPNRKQLTINRTINQELERDIPYTVTVDVINHSVHSIEVQLVDGLPDSFERPFPIIGKISDQDTKTIHYETKASIRGDVELSRLYLRYKSRFGLWAKQTTPVIHKSLKVIPDLTETKRYLENAQKFLLHEGLKIRKQYSGVGEFAKVRSYVVGDDPRKINWRQTAKLQEVMTNEYEPEHGKYITILIDCGRIMGAELTHGNRLERVLEAAMTVSAAALQKGDYVAVLAFSNQVKVYVPPSKGMKHLQTILHSVYSLKVDDKESNYAELLNYLQLVQKKRSLLLLFSDVRTFLQEESTLIYLQRLRKRHLFLIIGIRDETLLTKSRMQPDHVQAAMVKSMAQQQLLNKKKMKMKWEKQGLLLVEAADERLAVAAVSSYIELLNKGQL